MFVSKVAMIYHMSQDFRGESVNFGVGAISPPNSSKIYTVSSTDGIKTLVRKPRIEDLIKSIRHMHACMHD